ncbi:unnamed protein product [Tilletia controversa]|uniref:Uncharacterized protein n=1 Tax=Tilletia controversa TaxID=13291 RepID=A0A8X7MRX6_9BASI|nr:hypothetical protein A4X06_0g4655 [Tilletia controversa]CAD6950464.1 unnamed protein product [Tilletia controversa]CAD6971914.1 unnamed protein product [Tilletia controversa]
MYSVYLTESPSKRQKRSDADGAQQDSADASAGPSGSKPQEPADATASSSLSESTSSRDPITPAAHIEQLITEHLGFHPRVYIDQLTQLANDHLHDLNAPIEEEVRAMLQEQGSRPDAELEAEQGVHALVTLIENALDHTFDTFELYCLRSVFRVTPAQAHAVTLAHHRGMDLRSVEEKRAHLERLAGKSKRGSSRSKANAETSTEQVISAEDESRTLAERAAQLRKKIAVTRAVNATIYAATAKSRRDILDVTNLQKQLPILFGGDGSRASDDDVIMSDGDAALPENTSALSSLHPQLAVKVQGATHILLDSIASLRLSDPLGTSVGSSDNKPTGVQPGAEGEDDPSAGNALPWSSREGYLKFVADKVRT